jgi:hypothetical protein
MFWNTTPACILLRKNFKNSVRTHSITKYSCISHFSMWSNFENILNKKVQQWTPYIVSGWPYSPLSKVIKDFVFLRSIFIIVVVVIWHIQKYGNKTGNTLCKRNWLQKKAYNKHFSVTFHFLKTSSTRQSPPFSKQILSEFLQVNPLAEIM